MPVDYFPRQAGWVAIGLVLLVISMSIDYHVLLDFSVVLYGLGIASLVAVLAFGVVHGGAANWLKIGAFQFQPSEFAKIATGLFLARYLAGLNLRVLELRQIVTAIVIVGRADGAGGGRARHGRRRHVRAAAGRHAAGGRHPRPPAGDRGC